MRLLRTVAAASIVAATASWVSPSAGHADRSTTRTHGDARAAFEAGLSGGQISLRSGHSAASGGLWHFGDPEQVKISILQGRTGLECELNESCGPNHGVPAEYCASGWHLLGVNIAAPVVPEEPFLASANVVKTYLGSIFLDLVLDGTPLETTRTSIKPAVGGVFEDETAFWIGLGAFLPPGSLTVGTHDLDVFLFDPNFGDEAWTIEFIVLPC